MPFNGSGLFTRVYSWVTDANNGVLVRADRTDTDTDDIATGLSNCVTRDGQSPATANLPMGGFKHTGMANGSASTDSAAFGQIATAITQGVAPSLCEFRLTGISGNPVPINSIAGTATIYCTPYKGNGIALYDGSNWNKRTSIEFSVAVPAVNNKVYDIFCYDNAGAPTLELLVWTNDTTRATILTTQNGVYVKSGDATRRYLGSFRTNGSTLVPDGLTARWLWNYYNRALRPMVVVESTATWTYTTATIRQANANAGNQLDFLLGLCEDAVEARVYGAASNNASTDYVAVGIGLDSTTAFATGSAAIGANVDVASHAYPLVASATLFPNVGRHTLTWLEYSTAGGVTTWYGNNGGVVLQTGIHGWVWG